MLLLSALISVLVAVATTIVMTELSARKNREPMKEAAEQMDGLDKEIDRCIKRLRDAATGTELRTYITEYEELMFKKSSEILKLFLRK